MACPQVWPESLDHTENDVWQIGKGVRLHEGP